MEIVFRSAVVFLFLWILLRALGKRELTELTPFELVLVIVMGDAAQQGITQEDYSVTGAMLALGTMGLIILTMSYVTYRWKRPRAALEGLPALVVRDGEVIEQALRLERMTHDELLDAARQQGISSLDEVRFAVVEADGRLSFIKWEPEQKPQGEEHRIAE